MKTRFIKPSLGLLYFVNKFTEMNKMLKIFNKNEGY